MGKHMKSSKEKRFIYVILLLVVFQVWIAAQTVQTSREGARSLSVPATVQGFSFVILGDRTTGDEQGLDVLRQAVDEINTLAPVFVTNIGDMIQGYNGRKQWILQAKQFRKVIDGLNVPFYPVAGNHDVYWRGEGRPPTEHEADYEKAFGPLWYAYEYKNCWFIVLFSDEGDPATGEKNFEKASSQTMSDEQLSWLKDTLAKAKDADHVFVFLHHPRWLESNYGADWRRVHEVLKEAGNVNAVFAGHIHAMHYFGKKDGIEYFTLGTTGGSISDEQLKRQVEDHYFVVNVTPENYAISTVPVGKIRDPRTPKPISLLPQTDWHVDSESNRRLKFPIKVDDYGAKAAVLQVAVGGADDDSCDEGLWIIVQDAQQNVVKKAFSKSKGVERLNCNVQQGQSYTVVLDDSDTEFTGRNPGNGGNIQVYLEIRD